MCLLCNWTSRVLVLPQFPYSAPPLHGMGPASRVLGFRPWPSALFFLGFCLGFFGILPCFFWDSALVFLGGIAGASISIPLTPYVWLYHSMWGSVFFGGYHPTTTAEQGQRVGAKLTGANLELIL